MHCLQCYSMGKNPSKLPPYHGGSGHPCNTWLLGPNAPHTPNVILIEPAISSGLTLHYPYTLLWSAPSTPNNCPFPWRADPHLIHGECGPPQSICQTASRSVQPFLQDTSSLHDRHTDKHTGRHTDRRITPHASSNRPHLCYAYDVA